VIELSGSANTSGIGSKTSIGSGVGSGMGSGVGSGGGVIIIGAGVGSVKLKTHPCPSNCVLPDAVTSICLP